ncbi:MAG: universal stress protein [Blastococcus sp.]
MSGSSIGERVVGRIVVGVDGSPSSERALRWAAQQARMTGQELHAVMSWNVPVPHDEPLTGEFDWGGDAAGALMKTVENVLGEPDARQVVPHVTQGHPAKVLMDAARNADLLVVGSRGHGGFASLLLGSVSQHVIAQATCPVVVVHEHRTATGRIVVGVDGSPESERALRWAAGQARLTGGELHAVLVGHRPATGDVEPLKRPDWPDESQILAATVIAALRGEDSSGIVQEVLDGHPAAALLRAAEDADLLVVGWRGRGGFSGMLLGSVSRQVAAHAPCPVVVHHQVPVS